MAELERINGLLGLTIMGLLVLFLILYAAYRSRRKMHLFIPIFTTLLYIPYEGYYRNPQVLQGVPIRVDLFLFIPLMEAAYICALVGWSAPPSKSGRLLTTLRKPMRAASASPNTGWAARSG